MSYDGWVYRPRRRSSDPTTIRISCKCTARPTVYGGAMDPLAPSRNKEQDVYVASMGGEGAVFKFWI